MTFTYTLTITGKEIDDIIDALAYRVEGIEECGTTEYDTKWKNRLKELLCKVEEEAENGGVDVKESDEANKTERAELLANGTPKEKYV